MFESLTDRFDGILTRLRGRGRLSEADVDEVLREIRTALLEADVEIGVVRTFTTAVRERCVGLELSQSLSPGQQVIKIVNEELVAIQRELGLPVKLVGLGEGADDLVDFDPQAFVDALF